MNTIPAAKNSYSRDEQIDRLTSGELFDIVVIGGGATGAGIAVDAASRGYRVALCEQSDFGKGTSSRSTKLVHGGVRYLQQGNIHLVREALHERGLLLKNAPQLVHPLATIVPCYSRLEIPYYWTGLKAYDLLAGKLGIARSEYLTTSSTIEELPTIEQQGLCGGIRYYDAAFDDARLLVCLVQLAIDRNAACANYLQVERLIEEGSRVVGVVAVDLEKGIEHRILAKVVVNATGPFSDAVQNMADEQAAPRIRPSQGTHIVLDRAFLPTDSALIVPKTPDGRVIFAIPWHGHTLVGTTDVSRDAAPLEPVPGPDEVEFLLETISGYLANAPTKEYILSVFAGIRPLVATDPKKKTSKLARDHLVRVDRGGLISVLGGKWTTYRRMAEDAVDRAIEVADLKPLECRTQTLAIPDHQSDGAQKLASDEPELKELLAPALTYSMADVLWAIRYEMARTVEDVLSRRTRSLLLNAQAAHQAAPVVVRHLAAELGRDDSWCDAELKRFASLAGHYKVQS